MRSYYSIYNSYMFFTAIEAWWMLQSPAPRMRAKLPILWAMVRPCPRHCWAHRNSDIYFWDSALNLSLQFCSKFMANLARKRCHIEHVGGHWWCHMYLHTRLLFFCAASGSCSHADQQTKSWRGGGAHCQETQFKVKGWLAIKQIGILGSYSGCLRISLDPWVRQKEETCCHHREAREKGF